jgi:electron transfer flavoprotein beta subunit
MGADSAVHVKDPSLDDTDPDLVATALAAAIRTLAPFDLILTGQQGVGADNSQVPAIVAERLDLPQVTVAVKIEMGEAAAVVEREIEGGREVWETSLPAVISAQKGLNEPRYASLKGIMAAKKKSIQTLDAKALGLDPAALAPKTKVVAMELPAGRPAVRLIEGDAVSQANELIRLLHEEAKVI